jgi:hypothetical protein
MGFGLAFQRQSVLDIHCLETCTTNHEDHVSFALGSRVGIINGLARNLSSDDAFLSSRNRNVSSSAVIFSSLADGVEEVAVMLLG